MIIAIIAMAAARRLRRKAAIKCERKLKSLEESTNKILQADIPLINEAFRNKQEMVMLIQDRYY